MICEICKKSFKTYHGLSLHLCHNLGVNGHPNSIKEYYDIFLKSPSEGRCKNKNCPHGNPETKFQSLTKGYSIGCCPSCSQLCDEVKHKIRKTSLEKYGSLYPNQNNNVKNKIKSTMIERYGVDNALKCKELNNKRLTTNNKKYGGNSPLCDKTIVKKRSENYKEKTGVGNPMQVTNIKEKNSSNRIQTKIVNCYFHEKESDCTGCQVEVESWKPNYTLCDHCRSIGRVIPDKRSSEETTHKKIKTLIDRYGKDYSKVLSDLSKRSRRKIKLTQLKSNSHIFDSFTQLFSDTEFIENKNVLQWKCNKCGHVFEDNMLYHNKLYCPICDRSSSKQEAELYEFLLENNIESIIQNDRQLLKGQELDIYIPNKNLAIELDGLYWHGEDRGGKEKNYHLHKTVECRSYGIKLIHIFEDEWKNKNLICKSMILNSLGKTIHKLNARSGSIDFIDNKTSNNFLEINHIQGKLNSKVSLGIVINSEVVQLLTLGIPRYDNIYQWEILRFSTKLNTIVRGGFSKLLKHFIKEYKPSNIMTYANARFGLGSVYEKCGFTYLGKTDPNYYYIINGQRRNRLEFQKHKLTNNKLIKEYREELSEWENMKLNGYDRVWDCGNYKYELKLS